MERSLQMRIQNIEDKTGDFYEYKIYFRNFCNKGIIILSVLDLNSII